MKNKLKPLAICLAALIFVGFASSAEARHCHRSCSNFSLNIGALFPTPCVQERVVVEQYYPYCPQPVYVAPQPVVPVYVRPAPCYRQVYVAPRPVIQPGFSFSWLSCR